MGPDDVGLLGKTPMDTNGHQWTPMDTNGHQWTPMAIHRHHYQFCMKIEYFDNGNQAGNQPGLPIGIPMHGNGSFSCRFAGAHMFCYHRRQQVQRYIIRRSSEDPWPSQQKC